MPRPFTLLERVETPEGPLELRQRGERDFMITVNGRVLMSSIIHRSELAVAERACATVRHRPAPRVLIGGLGLGFTLRAALDALPKTARIRVAELNEAVKRWCEGPLSELTANAARDKRVNVVVEDVCASVRQAAMPNAERFDAIIVDLYEGPKDLRPGQRDPLYGMDSLRHTHAALTDGGVYAVWAEDPNQAFEQRLGAVGFRVEYARVRGGGPHHAVYVAVKQAAGKGRPAPGAKQKPHAQASSNAKRKPHAQRKPSETPRKKT
jgi:spermidine synthase